MCFQKQGLGTGVQGRVGGLFLGTFPVTRLGYRGTGVQGRVGGLFLGTFPVTRLGYRGTGLGRGVVSGDISSNKGVGGYCLGRGGT